MITLAKNRLPGVEDSSAFCSPGEVSFGRRISGRQVHSVARWVFALAASSIGCATSAQSLPWVQRLTSTQPPARYGAAVAFDASRGEAVLFGGQTATIGAAGLLNDTWTWNGALWSQHMVAGPSARTDVAMSYDSDRAKVVLFGGDDGAVNGVKFADTWERTGNVWTHRDAFGPSARGNHAMVYDAARHVTVLFGGVGSSRFADTWEWNGTEWTRRDVTGPSPRAGHAMAYDSSRKVVVLFGGYLEGGVLSNETWEWNGTVWTLRSTTGPAGRHGHVMTYDTARRVCVLVGGYLSGQPTHPTYSNETWEWNGSSWIQRGIAGPSKRFVPAMVYDTARKTTVLFGGHAETLPGSFAVSDETWELPPCFLITTQPSSQQPCLLQAATLSVASSATESVAYQWRKNGVPIDTTANPSAATAMFLISSARPADGGTYECVISNACGAMISDLATLTVCAADFNCDQRVDDGDFAVFAVAYDILVCSSPSMLPGCPADMNEDGFVDDADFALFAQAYDLAVCD